MTATTHRSHGVTYLRCGCHRIESSDARYDEGELHARIDRLSAWFTPHEHELVGKGWAGEDDVGLCALLDDIEAANGAGPDNGEAA